MRAVGEHSEAYCWKCAKFVKTTAGNRDVPFSDGLGIAPDILVFVCDDCDEVCAIPSQSTPAIAAARREALAQGR
jgi:hypothetical protein